MYFQRLFYEYERLYVSKIKDSQQICPLSANIYLHKPYKIILLTILLKRVDKTWSKQHAILFLKNNYW